MNDSKGGVNVLDKILRSIITLLTVIAGLMTAKWLNTSSLFSSVVSNEFLSMGFISSGDTIPTILANIFGGLVVGAIGFFMSPFLIKYLWKFTYWVEAMLNKMPIYDLLGGSL